MINVSLQDLKIAFEWAEAKKDSLLNMNVGEQRQSDEWHEAARDCEKVVTVFNYEVKKFIDNLP